MEPAELLELVEDADYEFQRARPEICVGFHFRDYLRRHCEQRAGDRLELRYPLLAKLAQSDLTLALADGEDVSALDYLAAFPELAASPAVVNDLLRTEARHRCGDDALKLREYTRNLPDSYRAVFDHVGLLSRYQLVQQIGEGGEAAVWLAQDCELNREVAVKIPHLQDIEGLQRFLREARLTAKLRHPSIVPVFGIATTAEGQLGYAMRRVELAELTRSIEAYHGVAKAHAQVKTLPLGAPLTGGDRSTPSPSAVANGEFKIRELRRMVTQLIAAARAVSYAHGQDYLHLDLKPSNILVGDFGETMVLDWGLAQSRSQPSSDFGGTPAYMSPEVARRQLGQQVAWPDERADVYGLGATLYQVLTNRPPFTFGTDEFSRTPAQRPMEYQQYCQRVATETPRSIRSIVPGSDRVLAAICHKALSNDPADRYASAKAFAEDLERWQADEETTACPFTTVQKIHRHLSRHAMRYARGLFGVLVLVAMLLGAWQWSGYRQIARQVDDLPSVSIESLPRATDRIVRYPRWAKSLLRERLAAELARSEPRGATVRRFRLALASFDPSLLGPLLGDLVETRQPDEFLVVAHEVRRYMPARPPESTLAALEAIREVMRDSDRSGLARLRAAAVLSATTPAEELDSDTTLELANELANELARADSQWTNVWVTQLRYNASFRDGLLVPLNAIFLDTQRLDGERINAARLLARMQADDAGALLALLANASPEQLAPILEVLEQGTDQSGARLVAKAAVARVEYRQSLSADENALEHERRDTLAARAANLTLGAWLIEPATFDPELLAHAPDPRLRTELVHRFRAAGFSATFLLERQADLSGARGADSDERHGADKRPRRNVSAARSALLLALSTYSMAEVPKAQKERLLEQIVDERPRVQDPELLASMEYLLGHWNHARADLESGPGGAESLGWLMGRGHEKAANHRMVAIPWKVASLPSRIGAPVGEGHQDEPEPIRICTIPRGYAIAAAEVTRAQFVEFLQDPRLTRIDGLTAEARMANSLDSLQTPNRPQADDPVFGVTFAEAAAYCNWLSEREGLQPCYPAGVLELALDHEDKPFPDPFPDLDEDLLERGGYRLPTEAEWELSCRAGTVTPRSYGFREAYLGDYCVYRLNTRLGPRPLGRRRPNAWGLFDMLGNVLEWCHPTAAMETCEPGGTFVDKGRLLPADEGVLYLRGGAHSNVPEVIRSAYRLGQPWYERHLDVGFRVARTLPESPQPESPQPESPRPESPRPESP